MGEDLVKRLREGATWDDDIEAANLIEELEAKLSKVITEMEMLIDVSTLMQAASSHDKHRYNTVVTDTLWAQWSKQLKFARATLTKLKG